MVEPDDADFRYQSVHFFLSPCIIYLEMNLRLSGFICGSI
jgi:hypothetical protein